MVYITIYGRTPSKKNSRQIFLMRGRIMNLPSADYKKWHDNGMKQINYPATWPKIEKADIEMVIYSPDARKFDLTNKAESLLDLLVDRGVLLDDNYTVVQNVTLRYGGIDRQKPRAEILITQI